jgi:hypothetical protein
MLNWQEYGGKGGDLRSCQAAGSETFAERRTAKRFINTWAIQIRLYGQIYAPHDQ